MASLRIAEKLNATQLHSGPSPSNAHDLTKHVAEFIVSTSYADIPIDVIELGKRSILDALGLALCGSGAETGIIIRRYLHTLGCGGRQATTIGTSESSPVQFAALANGIAIHNDDFDDTYVSPANGLGVHPTVTVLPPALALAESGNHSGKDLLTAYHIGVEVESKILDAIVPRDTENAFHPTGTCGSLGSAAACAKIQGLDCDRVIFALGIAAGQASGLRENFGTMTKSFTAGHAAESGVVASALAALGWTASKQILEAPLGFLRTESDTFDLSRIQGHLGKPWTFASPGVSLKRFPSGALTHPAMDELLRTIKQHAIRAVDVDTIDVVASSNVFNTLLHHHPTSGLEAKFSMEFCLSILLLRGHAGIGDFTDEVAQRPDVQAMVNRIRFRPDPQLGRLESERLMTKTDIRLRNGQTVNTDNAVAKGGPGNPLSVDDIAEKFRSCAGYAKWPKTKAESIIQQVRRLEELTDIKQLTRLLIA
jgi:2-methylcitrate dehydratase PrpD